MNLFKKLKHLYAIARFYNTFELEDLAAHKPRWCKWARYKDGKQVTLNLAWFGDDEECRKRMSEAWRTSRFDALVS